MDTKIVAIGGTVLGVAVGAAAGYLVARKQLEEKYSELASEEIAQAKEYFARLYKGEGYESPGAVVLKRDPAATLTTEDKAAEPDEGPSTEVLERVLKGLKYGAPSEAAPAVAGATLAKNIFLVKDKTDEVQTPDPKIPYIITVQTYMEGEKNYTQSSLTYYAQDDVLSDESDMPIEDVDGMVGNSNLDRFGFRSGDPKMVYVRNDRYEIDFEISRSEGSYAKEVGGFVEHSSRRPQRFRNKE